MNLKDIQNALIEKQKGLNADIETCLRISKENLKLFEEQRNKEEEKEKEFNKALNDLGVITL